MSSPHPIHPPHTEEERLLWLRLLRSRRVGPSTFWRLTAEAGSVAEALAMLPAVARDAGVSDYEPCPAGVARAELRAGRLAGARLLARGDPGWPPALELMADPPPLLWVLGDLSLLARPAVALVGARNASSLGLRMTRALADGLAGAGLVVVSGLARGVDAAAHLAALKGGTVAVMAGGVDVVYPPENAVLAQEIADRGLRISDQPMGVVPQARHFPRRNRLVAALSRAVVVVEAAARSGSLITARAALELGREVMAVPGHPMDGRAFGCNLLIRDGALLVRSAQDVVEALEAVAPRALPAEPAPQDAAAADSGRRRTRRRSAAQPEPALIEAAAAGDAQAGAGMTTDPGVGPTHAPTHAPTGDSPDVVAFPAPPAARRSLTETHALHRQILDRLGPSPLAEDQLIRDLGLPASAIGSELLTLELDGQIERRAGGLLAKLV